jgi:ribosomal protein S2
LRDRRFRNDVPNDDEKGRKMADAPLSIKALIESGVHFGHRASL